MPTRKPQRGPGRPPKQQDEKAAPLTIKLKPSERKAFEEYADSQRRDLGPAIIFLATQQLQSESRP